MTCWAKVPSFANIDQYVTAIGKFPMLTYEEELEAGLRKDEESISKLVLSHLRLGVSIARKYANSQISLSDLIGEANVGLMNATLNFDPAKGRFSTFATWYIKSAIHEYVLANGRCVSIATTKPQRKLYFNLRQLRAEMKQHGTLTTSQVKEIAEKLDVPERDVREMEVRMNGNDYPINAGEDTSEDLENVVDFKRFVSDSRFDPAHVLENLEHDYLENFGPEEALSVLDERERNIIRARYMSDSPLTLNDCAAIHGISAERVRQLEVRALKKMREALKEYA
jgi:RNA polymerase sigma-32 factor